MPPSTAPRLEEVHGDLKTTEIDLIAVHGLGADVNWSWKLEGKVDWLSDKHMLPAVLPKSRILLYNYDSTWHMNAPKTRLTLCGEDLVRIVHNFRQGNLERPIVFIGHSLGGNVIQNALLYANSEDEFAYLLKITIGCVFLGTPFRGSKFQHLANLLVHLMRPAGSHDGVIRDLSYDAPILSDNLDKFCRIRNKWSTPMSCFFELYETDYFRKRLVGRLWNGWTKGIVVEEASACIPGCDRIPLQTDHLKMNKFSGPKDPSFLSVSAELHKMCARAKEIMEFRQRPRPVIRDSDHFLKERPEGAKCLQDLFITDPSEDLKKMKRKKGERAKNTCEWMLGTEEISLWLGSESKGGADNQTANVLWLHGLPGTGKSSTSMFLVEELSKTFATTEGKSLAYFFCDSGFEERRTVTAILRGLLLQLLQQYPLLLHHVMPKYIERGAKLFASFDALWEILMRIADDEATGTKYCVIDALDECDQESQETLLKELKDKFASNNLSRHPNMRILITSRPYEEIRKYLKNYRNRDLSSFPESKQDIEAFIDEKIKVLKQTKGYSEKTTEKVTQILLAKAEGTFLWIGLACDELNKVRAKDAVKHLQGLPKGLHSLYAKLLDVALEEEKDKEAIKQILSFVAISVRPLTLSELSVACELHQTEDEEDRIIFTRNSIESCRLLVTVQDNKVLLLHQSVKDFLFSYDSEQFDILSIHANFAYQCIDNLIWHFHHTKDTGGNLTQKHFLSYSRRYWPEHAHMAGKSFAIRECHAEFFDTESECRDNWLKILCSDGYTFQAPETWSVFHVAARWGILPLLHHVLAQSNSCVIQEHCSIATDVPRFDDANYIDSRGVTPIDEAVRSGHTQILDVLLKHTTEELNVITRVTAAAAGNWDNGKELMTVLLDRAGDKIPITEDVVKAAAGNWGNGKEVMTLLLDRAGDKIPITEDVVKEAAGNWENGKEVMTLLLDRAGDKIPITADVVKAAAGNRDNGKEVMTLLLDRAGDKILITEEVVCIISGRFDKEIMTLLLDRAGDNIPITEEVVKAVARNQRNDKEVMTLLLDRVGARPLLKSTDFCFLAPVLWSFLGDSNPTVVASMLQHTAERCVASNMFQELLCLSAEKQAPDSIMEFLLQHGTSWTTPGIYGWTPSMCAEVSNRISLRTDKQPSISQQQSGLLKPERWRSTTSQRCFDFSDDDREAVVKDTVPEPSLRERIQLRADQFMPADCDRFYFEVTFITVGPESIIGVGFCHVDYRLSGMPGWSPGSWGYHGDDGKTFCQNGRGTDYGPTYGAEDVVGCGVNFTTNSVFFTKNGQYLGEAFSDLRGRLLPMCGVGERKTKLSVNFGDRPFVFRELESL